MWPFRELVHSLIYCLINCVIQLLNFSCTPSPLTLIALFAMAPRLIKCRERGYDSGAMRWGITVLSLYRITPLTTYTCLHMELIKYLYICDCLWRNDCGKKLFHIRVTGSHCFHVVKSCSSIILEVE